MDYSKCFEASLKRYTKKYKKATYEVCLEDRRYCSSLVYTFRSPQAGSPSYVADILAQIAAINERISVIVKELSK